MDGLKLIALERAYGVGLLPETLYGIHDSGLICSERLANRSKVVDILGHHVEDLRKVYERNKSRIEALLLRRIGACLSAQIRILTKPVVYIEDLLRIGRRGADLRQQGVWVKSDRSEQLIELIGSQSVLSIRISCRKDDARQPNGTH